MGHPAPVPRIPQFQRRPEPLKASELNLMVDAINALAARLDKSQSPRRFTEYTPPFQILPLIEEGEDRVVVSPGCVMTIEPQESDATLNIRNFAINFTGTGNSAYPITPLTDFGPNSSAILNQIANGGTNIAESSNGYYLALKWDALTLVSVTNEDANMGGNQKWVSLEFPQNLELTLIPTDDWQNEDNVTSNSATRYLGPLGFCKYVANSAPEIVNYWRSDIVIPLYYRDSAEEEQVIVSADSGNEITAGSDGGAYYQAPPPPP